jgi:hypothetical protein
MSESIKQRRVIKIFGHTGFYNELDEVLANSTMNHVGSANVARLVDVHDNVGQISAVTAAARIGQRCAHILWNRPGFFVRAVGHHKIAWKIITINKFSSLFWSTSILIVKIQ